MASAQLSAKGMSVFSDNILKLLGDSGQSDIDLICEGQVFHSFKCFLSISSPRFAEIFDSDKDIKVLDIPDVKPDILELVLQYVYSAKLDEMDMSVAPALYEAAANYDIFPLKRLCGSYIIRNVREDTVCEILLLASKFPTKDNRYLMNAAKNFMVNNRGFLESNSWKDFSKKFKQIAKKLQDCLPY